jgi:hypothetical protein
MGRSCPRAKRRSRPGACLAISFSQALTLLLNLTESSMRQGDAGLSDNPVHRRQALSKVPMLFLLNDVVLSLDSADLAPPITSERFAKVSLSYVAKLGKELYAAEPLLHIKDREKAQRLAALIIAKAPDINAALFIAPARGCLVDQVQVRYAQLSMDVMGSLFERQKAGVLSNVEADRQVWRRLAA